MPMISIGVNPKRSLLFNPLKQLPPDFGESQAVGPLGDILPVYVLRAHLQNPGDVAEVLFRSAFTIILQLLHDDVFERREPDIEIGTAREPDGSGHPGAIELAIVRDDHIDLQSRLKMDDVELKPLLDCLDD